MTDEETKTDTDVKKPEEETTEEAKPVSIVDEARAIRDDIKKQKEEFQEAKKELDEARSEELLSSTAGGHIEPAKLTDEEAASRKRIKAVGLAGGAQWAKKMDKEEGAK